MLVPVKAAPVLIQLPANMPRKPAADCPSSWAPANQMVNQEEVLAPALSFPQPCCSHLRSKPSDGRSLPFKKIKMKK